MAVTVTTAKTLPPKRHPKALKTESCRLLSESSASQGGIQSGMGYLGAATLSELRQTLLHQGEPAGQRESAPHDVPTVKTSDTESPSKSTHMLTHSRVISMPILASQPAMKAKVASSSKSSMNFVNQPGVKTPSAQS